MFKIQVLGSYGISWSICKAISKTLQYLSVISVIVLVMSRDKIRLEYLIIIEFWLSGSCVHTIVKIEKNKSANVVM